MHLHDGANVDEDGTIKRVNEEPLPILQELKTGHDPALDQEGHRTQVNMRTDQEHEFGLGTLQVVDHPHFVLPLLHGLAEQLVVVFITVVNSSSSSSSSIDSHFIDQILHHVLH